MRETLSFSSVNPPATSKCKVKAQAPSVQFPLRIAEAHREDLAIQGSEVRRSSHCLPGSCRPGSSIALSRGLAVTALPETTFAGRPPLCAAVTLLNHSRGPAAGAENVFSGPQRLLLAFQGSAFLASPAEGASVSRNDVIWHHS